MLLELISDLGERADREHGTTPWNRDSLPPTMLVIANSTESQASVSLAGATLSHVLTSDGNRCRALQVPAPAGIH